MNRMETPAATTPGRTSGFFLLLIATALYLFVNGRWMIPIAAWLAPVFLLRFMRTQRPLVAIPLGLITLSIVNVVVWRGLVPVPGGAYYAIAVGLAAMGFLPFIIDRIFAPRLSGLWATLVLPLAAVALEFANTSLGPYGSWGASAYTQTQDLPLLQILSVTGLCGVAFLIHWSAAVINAAWETGFDWSRCRSGLLRLAAVLVLVHFAGGARLLQSQGATVRVASFTVRPRPALDIGDLLSRRRAPAAMDSVHAKLGVLRDSLLARAAREAAAGARIVFWSECNAVVMKSDEADFIARGEALAKERGIYLGMALASFTPGQGYYENLLVIACPEGRTIARYHKGRPVPGDPERGADLHLPVVETPHGRMAGAICFDGDFPSFIHQAGEGRAGILIVPSSDWLAIDPIHTRMALLRGIENGCSVVRQTNQGLSAACDAYGRILASADYFTSKPTAMVAQVPTRRVHTIYRRVGDLFAWICIPALLILAVFSIAQRGAKRFSTSATTTQPRPGS